MSGHITNCATMTIVTTNGTRSFPVLDVVWTRALPTETEPFTTEIEVTVADDLAWGISPNPREDLKSWYSRLFVGDARSGALTPDEVYEMFISGQQKEQQEESMSLYQVFVIDLEKQELLSVEHVFATDIARAVVVATIRLGLKEADLGTIKFHVHKICDVPAFAG